MSKTATPAARVRLAAQNVKTIAGRLRESGCLGKRHDIHLGHLADVACTSGRSLQGIVEHLERLAEELEK